MLATIAACSSSQAAKSALQVDCVPVLFSTQKSLSPAWTESHRCVRALANAVDAESTTTINLDALRRLHSFLITRSASSAATSTTKNGDTPAMRAFACRVFAQKASCQAARGSCDVAALSSTVREGAPWYSTRAAGDHDDSHARDRTNTADETLAGAVVLAATDCALRGGDVALAGSWVALGDRVCASADTSSLAVIVRCVARARLHARTGADKLETVIKAAFETLDQSTCVSNAVDEIALNEVRCCVVIY
jgi:hypothetical protein